MICYWAQLDKNKIVKNVTVVDASKHEDNGYRFLVDSLGGQWVQSPPKPGDDKALQETTGRKNFASIGSSFDKEKNAFIEPQPFDSWLLDEETCQWVPPKPKPSEEKGPSHWDEETQDWIIFSK